MTSDVFVIPIAWQWIIHFALAAIWRRFIR